jgi:hypothetical protein
LDFDDPREAAFLDNPPKRTPRHPIISGTCRGLMNLTAHLRFVTTPPGIPLCKLEASAFGRCLSVQVPNDQ